MSERSQASPSDIQVFRDVFNASPIGIAIETLEGRPLFVNPALCAMLGYSEEEMRNKHCVEFSPPEDAEKDWALFQQLRAGSIDHYQIEKRYLRRDGSLVWGRLSVSLLSGHPSPMVVALVDDVTGQRAAEEALRESEERFRLIADTAPVLMWMSGTDKLCIYFNKPWLDFTGRTIEDELGNGWAEGVHPDDLSGCLHTYTQSFDRREKFRMEYRLRRHDGEYRWVLDIGVPRFEGNGSFVGYIGIAIDVTERKRAEEALRESEEKFRSIFQGAGVGMVIVSPEGQFLAANETFCNYLGYTEQELQEKTVQSVTYADDWPSFSQKLNAALAGESGFQRFEKRCLHKNGRIVCTESTAALIRDYSGKPLYFVGEVLDVTKRKEAEEALSTINRRLIEAQEKERTRIARELHDDINQQLAMLAIELEQLQEDPVDARSRLQKLWKDVAAISSDVEALSHELHSSKLDYLGVIAGMRSWCQEFGERQAMHIDFRSDIATVLRVEVGLSLFRVLQEALHNAVKHSGVKRVEVQLSEQFNEVHLTINDSGRGFDVEAALQGKGLGLTSMRERIRLVNGTISIDSKPMRGTSIHIRIPLESQYGTQRAAG